MLELGELPRPEPGPGELRVRLRGSGVNPSDLKARQARPLPDAADDAAGACLGIPAMTAFHAVERLGALAGRTVLVIGASSSVGHYAAQLAVQAGGAATIDYKREAAVAGLGRLPHTIGGRWPLDGIVAAHEAVEQGTLIGNAVLEIAP